MDGQALFVPAASGQEGEQEAQCSPRSALPVHTRLVLLGLPRSCLKTSGSGEHSEGAEAVPPASADGFFTTEPYRKIIAKHKCSLQSTSSSKTNLNTEGGI